MPDAKAKQPSSFQERDDWLRAVLASDLPHVAVRVALAIGAHLHVKSGRCDPSFAGIAAASHVSERTVYRLVSLLEHTCWIAMQRTGGRHRNQYTLLNPVAAQSGFNPDKAPSGSGDSNPDTAASGSTLTETASNPDTTVAVKKRRTTKKEREGKNIYPQPSDIASRDAGQDTREPDRKKRTPKASRFDIDSAFVEFYASCPKKVGPTAARRAYGAAIKRGADPVKIIAAIKQYAAEVAGERPRHIKNPANWLNDGYYDNEPLPGTGSPTIDNITGDVIADQEPQNAEEYLTQLRGPSRSWGGT